MIASVPPTIRQAFLLSGALALSLATVGSAQDSVNRIRGFDAVLTVHSDGSFAVTEELTVELAGASNEIVRELSLRDDRAPGGAKKPGVTVLAVTDENGQPLRVEETSADGGRMRRLRIWIEGASDTDTRIEIRYRVANGIRLAKAGRKVGALDEVRWTVIGSVDTPIDSVRARVVLPPAARPVRSAADISAGDSAAVATTRTNGNEVGFTLSRALSPQEGMTVVVAWPSGHIHPKPASSPLDRLVTVLLWWPLLIPVIVFLFAFRAWDKTGRDPKEKSHVVRYQPVDDVSPAGLGKLVYDTRTPHPRIVVATLVDLAIRGFLRIEETTPNILVTLTKDVRAIAHSMLRGESGSTDYIIHFVRGPSQWKGLKWHEERLLDGLISAAPSDGDTKRERVRVSMLTNKFYVSLPEIFAATEFELVAKGYYRKSPGSVKVKWLSYASFPFLAGWALDVLMDRGLAVISDDALGDSASVQLSRHALAIGIMLSSVILGIFAAIMPSRTVVGARAREAGLGFKEFLSRVEPMTSVEMFERYLPYAIAFGVEGNWAHAFEGIYVKPPSWYTGPMGEFSATSFGHRIGDLTLSAASSMSSKPSESGGGGLLGVSR